MTGSVRSVLEALARGEIDVDEGLIQLRRRLDTENLGFARIDHHRQLRQGLAEVVYGEGKLPEESIAIVTHLCSRGAPVVIATRVDPEVHAEVSREFPGAVYHPRARLLIVEQEPPADVGSIVIAVAGTTDLPVAEEAYYVARALGNRTQLLVDVGVAGVHRLLDQMDALTEARVIIVVAGMEGALASVVGGLVDRPVLAVPSPVGYGAAFGGVTALLAMLSSCALGVGVLNIGNGVGAAFLASKINHLGEPGHGQAGATP